MAALTRLRKRARRGRGRLHRELLARVPPGALPSGWVAAPPDFVGVGAQKCGTSWWYAAIAAHSRVYSPPAAPKERHYFDRFWDEPFTPRAESRYGRLFPRPAGSVSGEWTPRYMHDVWTPALLARAAPEARLLVMLRDPVERFRSGVARKRYRSGVEFVADAFVRGLYHAQLDRLLRHFDRERILILQLERCRDHPDEELRRTQAFLGLEEAPVPTVLRRRVNATKPAAKRPLEQPLLDDLRRAYRDDSTRLFETFPELDPALWRTLAL